MTFFIVEALGYTCSALSSHPSADVIFHNGFFMKTSFSIWPLMEYGNQQQPLIFMCVRLLGSHLFILLEVNVRWSNLQLVSSESECLRTTQGLFSGSSRTQFKCCCIFLSDKWNKSTASRAFDIHLQRISILQLFAAIHVASTLWTLLNLPCVRTASPLQTVFPAEATDVCCNPVFTHCWLKAGHCYAMVTITQYSKTANCIAMWSHGPVDD